MAHPHAFVVLRRDGVAAVLDVTAGRLPALVHWGADLGPLTLAEVDALVLGGVQQVDANLVDEPLRVSVLPEHWTGWTGRPGVSGSRGGPDWSPRFAAVALSVDGREVPAEGDEPVLVETGSGVVQVRAEDPGAGLGVVLELELTAGGLLRSRATLTNTGEGDYQLDDLVLAYPLPGVAREVLDLAGRWGKERTPQRAPLHVGTHLREGRKGRTGADAATVLHVGTPGFGFADGEIWAVHTAWSGNHTHYAERLFTGQQVVGGGELLLPGEVRLATGESYTSPWVYGSHGTGLDAVARRFHRYLRSRPQHPGAERPVTLNVWEAVYFDHDLERLLDLAERAAALGVERYVLDDGWFGSRRDDRSGLGDWVVSPDVWPEGLHPLVDRVRELGMEFGLWFEPEMVNLDSDVARAHPEWVMATGGRTPVPSRNQQVLNLGIPEAYAHVRDQMMAILGEYAIGYLKWDHNRDLVDAGTSPSGRAGVHEQTLAFYRLVDELKATHPGLEIESCSSGGARVDLGVLERTDRVWVSDCIDPLERQEMHRWTTQLIPPEMMGAHVASGRNHTTGRVHDLDFRAATAVFGHLGIEWDLARASEQELAELGGWVAFFKEHRRLLLGGDLVRVDHPDDALVAHGVVSPDRGRAIFGFHAVGRSEVVSLGRLRFPGLDPARRYRVAPVGVGEPSGLRAPAWWDADGPRAGIVVGGAALGSTGLMSAGVHPDHSVLYRLDAVD
ncbi:alpha-galactosidase [Friedmanniella luteola]|uniref:Alpha-galactosidase n=1 Tax=Friedmanniella luteola TaxID=546871 RepID=A0A1H1X1D1_9ACTN|nr:alpha-galactosidase [Friedmanniella luteola]SDT03153.1 alpha-galactosidase [Friedmanniella luteola]